MYVSLYLFRCNPLVLISRCMSPYISSDAIHLSCLLTCLGMYGGSLRFYLYFGRPRKAFSHDMDRVTMSLDGTDCANGKVVTCVLGDADRDLHGWQIADPNFPRNAHISAEKTADASFKYQGDIWRRR